MLKRVFFAFAISALAGTSTLAAHDIGATLSKDKKITSIAHGSTIYTPPPAPPPGPEPIFSNIGTAYPKGLYFCCYGNTISGPDSAVGGTYWLAAQFTPSANFLVTDVDAAVGLASGTSEVDIALYSDNGGVPGTQLAKGKAKTLKAFGACCHLAVLKIRNGVAVTGGTPYWVVVTTDKKGTDTWAVWNFNSTDQIDPVTVATSNGAGWTNASGEVPAPSFAVLGDPN